MSRYRFAGNASRGLSEEDVTHLGWAKLVPPTFECARAAEDNFDRSVLGRNNAVPAAGSDLCSTATPGNSVLAGVFLNGVVAGRPKIDLCDNFRINPRAIRATEPIIAFYMIGNVYFSLGSLHILNNKGGLGGVGWVLTGLSQCWGNHS